MAETDALADFDFDKVGGGGLFLKFEAKRDVTLRVLTVDPIVSQREFEDSKTHEMKLNTSFLFIVYNFTDGRAQIMRASPGVAKTIGQLHVDQDFGANIRNTDIKIKPTGEGLERRYEIQVLRHSGNETKLTAEQVAEAKAINLEKNDDGTPRGYRLSEFDKKQKEKQEAVNRGDAPPADVANLGDEPINLDDIPF
jgi:hypothetical protein